MLLNRECQPRHRPTALLIPVEAPPRWHQCLTTHLHRACNHYRQLKYLMKQKGHRRIGRLQTPFSRCRTMLIQVSSQRGIYRFSASELCVYFVVQHGFHANLHWRSVIINYYFVTIIVDYDKYSSCFLIFMTESLFFCLENFKPPQVCLMLLSQHLPAI